MNIEDAKKQADRMALLLDASLTAIRSKSLFADMFISDPTPCIVYTLEGEFKIVNPAFTELLGYSSKELKGRQIVSLIHPEDVSTTLDAMAYAAKGFEPRHFINRYRHKNGQWVWTLWHPQHKANDDVYGIAFCSLLEKYTNIKKEDLKAGFIDAEKLNINIH